MTVRRAVVVVALLAALSIASRASAYSVLAHEAMVDALWDPQIAPMLRARYPSTTADGLRRARAFAYGGSVIQDLGYYPFGSHLFTNLVHYVRSGDFVEALVRDARDVNEFAFALGALAHYCSDNDGHPIAVNRAVPLVYPKLRSKYGDTVTYAEDPKRHVMVEFAFDVVQVAGGAYLPDAYRAFVGFEVATPLLERAFRDTYALELKDLFVSVDLAVGTYRHAVAQTIPEMTRVAWEDKQDAIQRITPHVQRDAFVHTYTREHYESLYGTMYRKPGAFAKFLAFAFRLLPKVGPMKPLAFTAPTPEAERLFAESFRTARGQYRDLLRDARDGRVTLSNTDFDTGKRARWGEYPLADKTYVDLLDKLTSSDATRITPALRGDLERFLSSAPSNTSADRKTRKRLTHARQQLARLTSVR
jgi:hypothetical protein